jgi:hypothetical protein
VSVRGIAAGTLLCGAAFLIGCEPAGGIGASGGGAAGPLLTPRTAWRAYGDLREPAKAIDGDISTAAVSGMPYANSYIEVDLGKACLFNRIIIDHGPDEQGVAARIAVFTSQTGQSYTSQGEFTGQRRVTNILLLTPVIARYVRLQAVVAGPRAWSVAEIGLE